MKFSVDIGLDAHGDLYISVVDSDNTILGIFYSIYYAELFIRCYMNTCVYVGGKK